MGFTMTFQLEETLHSGHIVISILPLGLGLKPSSLEGSLMCVKFWGEGLLRISLWVLCRRSTRKTGLGH